MDETGAESLKKISDAIGKGEPPPSYTVRALLSWFGAQRRGVWVVAKVKEALDQAGLITEPDFESAFIDSHIQFRTIPKPGGDDAVEPPFGVRFDPRRVIRRSSVLIVVVLGS